MVQGLGERLQQKRACLKISQKEAAEAIGVSYSIISNYEKNERTPSLEKLMALANLYHCSVDYLLGIEKHPVQILMFQCSMMNKYPACNIFFPV